MAHKDVWQSFQVATPADKFWSSQNIPRRGEYGGNCSSALCSGAGADWYHRDSRSYYCDSCARRINEGCLRQGRPKLCELHT